MIRNDCYLLTIALSIEATRRVALEIAEIQTITRQTDRQTLTNRQTDRETDLIALSPILAIPVAILGIKATCCSCVVGLEIAAILTITGRPTYRQTVRLDSNEPHLLAIPVAVVGIETTRCGRVVGLEIAEMPLAHQMRGKAGRSKDFW